MVVNDLAKVFQALSDPTRLAVFLCIKGCGGASTYDTVTGECDAGSEGAIAACDVRCHVPCAPSTLTHHLNALREVGLIETERIGRKVFAKVVPSAIEGLVGTFLEAKCCCRHCASKATASQNQSNGGNMENETKCCECPCCKGKEECTCEPNCPNCTCCGEKK